MAALAVTARNLIAPNASGCEAEIDEVDHVTRTEPPVLDGTITALARALGDLAIDCGRNAPATSTHLLSHQLDHLAYVLRCGRNARLWLAYSRKESQAPVK
jgi:hypothetical protein